MAVLEIVSNIKHSLGNAISYIQNVQKTMIEDGTRLISNNMGGELSPQKEATRMLEQVAKNPKGLMPGSRVAQHLVQSFSAADAENMTVEEAHQLGVRMAEEITGGDCLYIVATHITQAKLHNHILICNHSSRTGRANQWGARDLLMWRKRNDAICKSLGLSTLPEPQMGHEIPATEMRQTIGSLYAQADGQSWVEMLKDRIDKAGAACDTFAQFRAALHKQGISVTPRGKHLTYMVSATGRKIRDTRLGEAYTPANIYGRLAKRPVTEISFSRRLIVRRKNGTVRIMVPGTHGDRRLTLREDQILQTGPGTFRAWIPQDRPITLTDRRGHLAGRATADSLTAHFLQRDARLEYEYKTLHPHLTTAQQQQANRAYIWQARQIARTRQRLDALRIIEANNAGGHDTAAALDALLRQNDDARSSLAAQISALSEADRTAGTDPTSAETPQARQTRTEQIRLLEDKIASLEWQIRTVKTVQQDELQAQKRQEEQQQERQERYDPGPRL